MTKKFEKFNDFCSMERSTFLLIFKWFICCLMLKPAFSQYGDNAQFLFFESRNDSIDLANNLYDFSDSLLYLFRDPSFFPDWDTSSVFSQTKFRFQGDSIVLPLLLTPKQIYVHPFCGRVTSRYGPRGRRFHFGIDIDLITGDTIKAVFDGVIRYNGYTKGYGLVVIIRHLNGLETLYAHLTSSLVNTNQFVFAGEPIGLGGSTGRSTGDHLHFEVRFQGIALNPQDIIDFENCSLKVDTLILYNKPVTRTVSTTSTATASTSIPQYHIVRSGDTLGKIAIKYGTTVERLCKLNNMRSTDILRVGQKIRVR